MLEGIDDIYLVYALAAGTAVFGAEAIYLLFFTGRSYRNSVNHRLRVMDGQMDRESILLQLRRERGLDESGNYLLPIKALNLLIMQSGVRFSVGKLALIVAFLTVAGFVGGLIGTGNFAVAGLGAVAAGIGMPIVLLMWLRAKRLRAFGDQFAGAIDIIVRSLKAGHPVPVAIGMVAREMEDPVGTEFGIVADEVTYGADMESAMRSLQVRVGHPDLYLFVTSVSIQTQSGGNLREILQNLSDVIRGRIKMRRKIKSVSSEGRAAAMILSFLPGGFFAIVQVSAPHFYGGLWGLPQVQYTLAAAGLWMLLGMAIMYRMTKFKI